MSSYLMLIIIQITIDILSLIVAFNNHVVYCLFLEPILTILKICHIENFLRD